MRKIIKRKLLALFVLPLVLAFGQCPPNEKIVTVSYQHLASFQYWHFDGDASGTPDEIWRIYMIRGIINKRKDAKPFNFDLQNFRSKGGGKVSNRFSELPVMTPYMLPFDYKALIEAQQVFTVPAGTGALFIIRDTYDKDPLAQTALTYLSSAEQSVILVPLDIKAPIMFRVLDEGFIQNVQLEQFRYEEEYTPDGLKH